MAPSRHIRKIVYCDVKQNRNETNFLRHIYQRDVKVGILFLRIRMRNRAILFDQTLISLLNNYCYRLNFKYEFVLDCIKFVAVE